ncbi:uncharacterized protein LOC127168239 isoform X2 [Labeo rohita]|uniref:uncharacterized protein LOC127168239 isoform X2 n=1 Tax=Labeo rohita TaxID=84645 RepID=UPI0021E2E449|nr:uncharacterized protein LOC127168239 isoform X2 [Labeo rohita]
MELYRKETSRNLRMKLSTSPPISNGIPPKSAILDHHTRGQTTAQRLQELFFSQGLRDHGPLDRSVRKKKNILGHQSVPLSRVSVETELEITAHLKYHLHERHLKGATQNSSLEEKKAVVFQQTRTILFNDQVSSNSPPDFLQSLVPLDKKEKEEKEDEEKEKKEQTVIVQNASSCTDEAPEGQGSLSEGPFRAAEVDNKPRSDERGPKPQHHSSPNTVNDISSLHFKQRRFLIYLCGGYKDTVPERSALMETVYPRLYLHCKQRGYDFRMIDLRSGVGDPVSDNHDLAEMHMETLRRCQETEGLTFFVFTGQKHEIRSLPNTIPQADFEAILKFVERNKKKLSRRQSEMADESQLSIDTGDSGSFTLEKEPRLLEEKESSQSSAVMSENSISSSSTSDGEEIQLARSWMDYEQDLTLLQTWYKLDKNTVPAVYRLLPVSTHHPDYLSRDGHRRKLGRKAWRSSCVKLWNVLWRSGPEAIGEEATCHLLRTALDWEVEQGLGGKQPPEEYSHCYKRIITDLLYNLKNEYAPQFIDLHKGRPEINQTLHQAHQRFIRNIHLKLRHTNIHETNVSWGRKGLSAKHNRSHQFYVERLCSHFQRTVTASLNRLMQVREAKGSFDMQRKEVSRLLVEEEIHRHVRFGKTLAQGYAFRQDFLMEVKRALEALASSQKAVLLLGESGSGKSTTLAKLAQLIPSWIPGDAKVLICFVGLTSDSRNVRLLLQSLCLQLANIYSLKTEISESLSELSSELCSLLGLVTEDRPLTLVLDGLDNLSEEHEADLSWLSNTLLPNVITVLSASTQSKCAHILQSQVKVTVLSLPALNHEDITSGLASRLESDFRQLTENQWSLLLQSCLSCPSPLYLNLAYAETRKWSSFTPKENLNIPTDPNKFFVSILVSLEREHGPCLVRRTALLISLSRSGVTEEELLVLLGRDDHVMREMAVLNNQTLPVSEYSPVPYAFVARLLHGLKGYVTEVESDGTWVLRWTHAEFTSVALQRYTLTEDSIKAVHADFADYFNGNVPNSQVFQPLAWIRKEKGRSVCLTTSFCCINCGVCPSIMSRRTLKLPSYRISTIMSSANKELLDVKVLGQILCLSHSVLLKDPCQLASQLLGRLEQIISQDKPVTSGDPRRYSYLHDLLAQCKSSSLPVLVPSYTCLLPPGGLVHTHLSGHMSAVTALAHGRHYIISCSSDGMLNLWHLDEQTRPVRSLPRAHGSAVDWPADSLALCLDDSVLVLQMGHCLQVREVDSGKVLYVEKDSLDVPVVTTACNGRLLVVFYDGSHLVKVFDLVASCLLLRCVNLTLEFEAIHKDQSILLSHHSVKDFVLFAYRDGGEAAIFSAKGGVVPVTLKAQHPAASIQAVEISSQYLLLFCRYPYKRHSEIIHIELFSTASFQYLRSILGCSQDYISQVTIAGGGSHIVAFCPAPHSATTEIIIWNLETEDHKHIARFPGLLAHGVCSDLRYCVGFCLGERFLRMWNLGSRINDQTLTYNVHKAHSDGTAEIVTMHRYPRYVVCQSTRPGTVRIWNVARTRFKGHPVQVEHGLFSSSDIALVRDLKLYILSDRGTANFTDTPTSVYQTLLVYDLLKKSYIKKQTGLFIVPCPRQDYRLLEGEILLGLSETRDHLILWDLDSGYIKGRIKTSYKETVLSSMDRDSQIMSSKEKTGLVMPWDRRSETQTAKRRRQEREVKREKDEQQRLEKEKFNSIDQYLLSGDEQVVICSYFAHHLNVFSVVSEEHLHTLEDRWSLLSLRTAAITHTGGYLVVSNYSEAQHAPYLTLWDTQQGRVRKRLKNEPGVCCIAISDDAYRVVFGIAGFNKLKVWEPFRRKHKTISGYGSLNLNWSSLLFIADGQSKAILLSEAVSMWDLDNGTLLSVFTPDSKIQTIAQHGPNNSTLLLGFSDMSTLISMTVSKQDAHTKSNTARGKDLFGESSSSEDEEDEVTNKN